TSTVQRGRGRGSAGRAVRRTVTRPHPSPARIGLLAPCGAAPPPRPWRRVLSPPAAPGAARLWTVDVGLWTRVPPAGGHCAVAVELPRGAPCGAAREGAMTAEGWFAV